MNLSDAAKVIKYDPDSGEVTRTDRKGGGGSTDAYGYRILKYKGHQLKLHRVIWRLMTGKDPVGVVDHKNGIRDDNRWTNLQDISQAENVKRTKRKPNKETGVVGVYLDKSTNGLIAKYTTRINGKTFRFRTLEEAKAHRIRNKKQT